MSTMKKLHCDMKRCGRGCTEAEYQRAVHGAAKLKKILGVGWHTEVWENLGWHYKAVHQTHLLSVYADPSIKTYTAYLNDRPGMGGQWIGKGRTPHKAIKNVKKNFLAYYNVLQPVVKLMESFHG
jgi:hypothetical protein